MPTGRTQHSPARAPAKDSARGKKYLSGLREQIKTDLFGELEELARDELDGGRADHDFRLGLYEAFQEMRGYLETMLADGGCLPALVDPPAGGATDGRSFGDRECLTLDFDARLPDEPASSGSPRRPDQSKKKGGRPPKWRDLLELDAQLRAANQDVTDREVINRYRQRFSRRKQPTVPDLRSARHYAKRKIN